MPNVPVFDLKINATTGRTMAFTHGRGAFALVDGSLAGQLQVTSFQLGATNVRIGFSSDLNQRYRIERSGRLPATAWTNVADNIPGTGAIIQTNDVRLPGPQFYRVRRL
jgi:hypothetical protein